MIEMRIAPAARVRRAKWPASIYEEHAAEQGDGFNLHRARHA
jgi:hypothetical protein